MTTSGQRLTPDVIDARSAAVRQYTYARWSAREIAGRLGVSVRTVTRHRARLRRQRTT